MLEEDLKKIEDYSYTMSTISSATEQDIGIGNLIHKLVQAYKKQQSELDKKDEIINNAIISVENLREYFSEDLQPDFIQILEILKNKKVIDW